MDALDTLMDEHRQIEQVLGSLETFASRLEQGADPAPLSDFVDFFRSFADRAHHGKEEEILFALMVARGYSREAGPVAVMLHDHEQGRSLVRQKPVARSTRWAASKRCAQQGDTRCCSVITSTRKTRSCFRWREARCVRATCVALPGTLRRSRRLASSHRRVNSACRWWKTSLPPRRRWIHLIPSAMAAIFTARWQDVL